MRQTTKFRTLRLRQIKSADLTALANHGKLTASNIRFQQQSGRRFQNWKRSGIGWE
jgi:hypothetical protein